MAKRIRLCGADRRLYVISYIYVAFVVLITLYPVYFTAIASISDPQEVYLGNVMLLPKGVSFEAYQNIFNHKLIGRAYLNTIRYTVVYMVVNVLATMVSAFVFSRKNIIGQRVCMFIVLFTMYFGGGLIPTYFNIRSLGLLDSMWALILPGMLSTYNMIVARTYMRTSIPEDLEEAAMIDGCAPARYFIRIVLPLSMPIIAVFSLYAVVGMWNSYMDAMIYLSNRNSYPLQLVLREILVQNSIDPKDIAGNVDALTNYVKAAKTRDLLKYALIIVSSAPLLALYPFCQKFFLKGVMVGSLKG